VDEGQDYNPYWWNTLRRVLRDGGEMVLAADETQDLYERARKWTDEQMTGSGFKGDWSRLETSYRMPTNLIEYLQKFAEQYLPGIEVNLPEPEALELNVWPAHLKWIQVNSYSDVVSSCIDAALEMPTLATPNLVSYSDIVLLVPDHRLGLDCVSLLDKNNFQPLHVFDESKREQKSRKMSFFAGDSRIKACTIHSFKGWEARYIVVAISESSFNSELAATYVALSRLKRHTEGSYLTVVCSAPGLEDFGKTWPSFEKRSFKVVWR
jgi:superfamily I DNA/RNA helicase